MANSVKYGHIVFDSGFLFGTDPEGATIRFSRAERALLTRFTQNPKAVLTRDELLDAISGPGSDVSDRNIDFLINRLRRKLKDPARNPVFIATQYGEGYVWVASRMTPAASTAGAFLVVGPIRGMRHLGPFRALAASCAEDFRSSLERRSAKESRVVIDEDCPPPEDFSGDKPSFAAELTFLETGDRLDCAVTLKAFATGQIIRVSRHTLATGGTGQPTSDRKAAEAAAEQTLAAIWETLAYRASAPVAPSAEPLAVRMHNASLLLADTAPWLETHRRLRSVLEREPDNHEAQLMLATNIHSKYLMAGPMILPHQDFRAQDEDEIERLTLASLPHLQDNPILMMAAGKLLYFVDRAHRALATEIVEQAFEATTAFATSFAILGQMRMHEGDIETALSLIERGLELCRDGSEFELYLMILKCQALLASGERKSLEPVVEAFYAKKAGTREALSIFFADPEKPPPAVKFLLENVGEAQARGMLVWTNYICARLFRFVEHRENLLRGPLTLFVGHLGPGVIPDDLRSSVPALVAALEDRHERPLETAAHHRVLSTLDRDAAR